MPADNFNPYRTWLGVQSNDVPPDYYQLLNLQRFEAGTDAICEAVERQMSRVRSQEGTGHDDLIQPLLNEISDARATLLNPRQRESYNKGLKEESAPSAVSKPPVRVGNILPPSIGGAKPPKGGAEMEVELGGAAPLPPSPSVPSQPSSSRNAPSASAWRVPAEKRNTAPRQNPGVNSAPAPMRPVGNPGPRPVQQQPGPRPVQPGLATITPELIDETPPWKVPLIAGGAIAGSVILLIGAYVLIFGGGGSNETVASTEPDQETVAERETPAAARIAEPEPQVTTRSISEPTPGRVMNEPAIASVGTDSRTTTPPKPSTTTTLQKPVVKETVVAETTEEPSGDEEEFSSEDLFELTEEDFRMFEILKRGGKIRFVSEDE